MLIRSEVIFAEDVEKIFGKRPWVSRSQEILNDEQNRQQDDIEDAVVVEDKEAEATDNAEGKESETTENKD